MSAPSLNQSRLAIWSWLCGGYEAVAFAYVMVLLGLAFLGTSAAAAILLLLLPRRWQQPVGQAMIQRAFRFALRGMRITGLFHSDLDALDALGNARGIVVAPNHPSLIDVMLVGARVPRLVCIAKPALWNNPFVWGSLRLAGYIQAEGNKPMIRRAVTALEAGHNLLIFPEGTRTPPGVVLGSVKPGFALMARLAHAPVQAVLIRSNSPYLQKGWPLLRRPPLPLRYVVTLGDRFAPGTRTAALVEALEAQHRAAPP